MPKNISEMVKERGEAFSALLINELAAYRSAGVAMKIQNLKPHVFLS
jgi:hypothetical protein